MSFKTPGHLKEHKRKHANEKCSELDKVNKELESEVCSSGPTKAQILGKNELKIEGEKLSLMNKLKPLVFFMKRKN